nr:Cas9 endonuclease PAM-interacting domain-containing protein [Ruminococcus albus]
MAKNSIRYVRYTYKRKGGLFNQMPERKKEGLVPRKQDLVAVKYGGYNNTSAAYFSLVKCLGGSIVIVPIELMVIKAIEDDLSFACKYVAEQLSDILSKNITEDMVSFPLKQRILKINTLLEIDGFRCNIVQKSNKGRQIVVSSAESLIIDPTSYNYVKKISAYLEKSEKGKKFEPSVYSGISHESNISLFDTLVDKMKNKPYNLFLSKIEKKISAKRDVFIKLSLTEQVLLLINMIKLLKTGRSTGCDLKLLGESGQAGVITINSDITKISGRKSINIIDQSPTGLFEKKSENLLDL